MAFLSRAEWKWVGAWTGWIALGFLASLVTAQVVIFTIVLPLVNAGIANQHLWTLPMLFSLLWIVFFQGVALRKTNFMTIRRWFLITTLAGIPIFILPYLFGFSQDSWFGGSLVLPIVGLAQVWILRHRTALAPYWLAVVFLATAISSFLILLLPKPDFSAASKTGSASMMIVFAIGIGLMAIFSEFLKGIGFSLVFHPTDQETPQPLRAKLNLRYFSFLLAVSLALWGGSLYLGKNMKEKTLMKNRTSVGKNTNSIQ